MNDFGFKAFAALCIVAGLTSLGVVLWAIVKITEAITR